MKLDWKTCFRVGVSIFVLFLCIHYWPSVGGFLSAVFAAAAPLFIGCGIAYVLNILLTCFEKIYFPNAKKSLLVKSRRPVCIIAAVLSLFAVVALIIGLIVPQLINCIQTLIQSVPGAVKSFTAWLDRWDAVPQNIIGALSSVDWQSKIGQIAGFLGQGIGSVMDIVISTLSSVFSGIVTALIAIIFSIYILSSKDRLARQSNLVINKLLSTKWQGKIRYAVNVLNLSFRRYIVGQCTEAVILGVLCAAGMLLLRLPYAAMISALIAFTALIPVAGAYIGAGVGAFMILTVSPVKALIFLVFIVVLQQLEGNIIYPRVVGSSLGLPGIWVLAAVTVGGGILGVLGMLLGVPLAAAVYTMLRHKLNEDAEQTADAAKNED